MENVEKNETNTFTEETLSLDTSSSDSIVTLESLLAEAEETPEVAETEENEELIEVPDLNEETEEAPPANGTEPKESKKEEETILELKEENSLNNTVKLLIEKGIWDNVETVEIDGEQVPLDEVDISPEMFESLAAFQEEMKKERLLENKIEADGISDFTKQLIEIEKKGGNVEEALRMYREVKTPLEQINLETEQGQVQALQLFHQLKGADEETIEAIIEGYKTKGILSDKAEQAGKAIEGAYQQRLDSLAAEAEQAKAKREENLKTYRKDFKQAVKDTFSDLKEATQNKLVDLASKETETGFEMDKLYNEIRRDPKKAAKLALFLLNEEEFVKNVSKEKVLQEQLKMAKTFKWSKNTGGNTDSLNVRERRKAESDLIDLDMFK